jgi:hypothetical protein
MSPKDDKPEAIETYSVPYTGRRYYGLGQTASYAAARRGDIPVIRIGGKLRVPKVLMDRRMLQPDNQKKPEGES